MSVRHRLTHFLILASIFSITYIFSSTTAEATVIGDARTTIDWSTLSIVTTSAYSWSGLSSSSEAEATNWISPFNSTKLPNTPNPDTLNSWGNTSQTYTNGGTGTGSTAAQQLKASGSVAVSIPETSQEAGAHVMREGFLTLAYDASVSISFNYLLEVTLGTADDDDWAFGIASFDTALLGLNSNGGGVQGTTLIKTLVGPGSYDQSLSSTMTISGNFLADEQIGFAVDAIAYTQGIKNYIPEPPIFWLLFPGMIMILAYPRKKASV